MLDVQQWLPPTVALKLPAEQRMGKAARSRRTAEPPLRARALSPTSAGKSGFNLASVARFVQRNTNTNANAIVYGEKELRVEGGCRPARCHMLRSVCYNCCALALQRWIRTHTLILLRIISAAASCA